MLPPDAATEQKALAPADGRLSGDLQSLSDLELDSPESVEELADEGQDLEAELVKGVEDAPGADQGAVKTHAGAEPKEIVHPYKDRKRI